MPSSCDLLLGALAHALLVEHPEHRAADPGQALLATEEQVARDVERGRDGEVLVDRLDAGTARVLRALEPTALAVEEDLAVVGDVGAREALDERRLAGAVVADDRQHLAGVQLEVDAVEADDGPNVLTRPLRLEHGLVVLVVLRGVHSCAYLPDPLVDRDGDDDEHADGEGLVEHVEPGERQPVAEHADDEGAEQGAPHAPRPPKRLVPPMTTAVIESRLRSTPAFGLAALMRPIWIQPAEAKIAPAAR